MKIHFSVMKNHFSLRRNTKYFSLMKIHFSLMKNHFSLMKNPFLPPVKESHKESNSSPMSIINGKKLVSCCIIWYIKGLRVKLSLLFLNIWCGIMCERTCQCPMARRKGWNFLPLGRVNDGPAYIQTWLCMYTCTIYSQTPLKWPPKGWSTLERWST